MFCIYFHRQAKKNYSKLDPKIKRRIDRQLRNIEQNPFLAPDLARLHGEFEGLYRIRIGEYRMILDIRTSSKEIFILAVGPRGNIYAQVYSNR